MIRDVAINMLNLIKENTGLTKQQIYTNPDMETQKIIDIILSETRCSITDTTGNYSRYGSSTDIRIIRNLIKLFLSDLNQIPPEIVSMALMKEETFGPFLKIDFEKIFNKEDNTYEIEMEKIFPSDFYTNIFQKNADVKEAFINDILKPYVKEIIYENEVLMRKNPIRAYLSKWFTSAKENEEQVKKLVEILKKELKSEKETDELLIENIASYMIINIMSNKFFQTELINSSIETTELQKLGKIYSGFNSLVDSMVSETIRMIELKSFPYGEYASIKNTYYTTIAVLFSLSTSFENLDEKEILNKLKQMNKLFSKSDSRKNSTDTIYRNKNLSTNKYGDLVEFVEYKDIEKALENLCKMMKVLLQNKDNIDAKSYIREVIRIHYRYLKIKPFSSANGRTSRAIVNVLLQAKGMVAIFRKEKRNEYIEWVRDAHKMIKENESKYIQGLIQNPMKCVEFENEFLDKELPFLLVKY